MSRVAKMPIEIPAGVELKIQGQKVLLKGPKGQVEYTVHPFVILTLDNKILKIAPKELEVAEERAAAVKARVLAGTVRAQLHNLIEGVHKGYERKLALVGVGFRAQMQGKKLSLSLGFSHPVEFVAPEGVTIEAPSLTEIIVKGADSQLVGQVAADIRALRPVEPYKGKGVRYQDEVVILKETKKK